MFDLRGGVPRLPISETYWIRRSNWKTKAYLIGEGSLPLNPKVNLASIVSSVASG